MGAFLHRECHVHMMCLKPYYPYHNTHAAAWVIIDRGDGVSHQPSLHMHISISHVLMNDSIFLDNVAMTYGGALMIQNFSSLTTHNNTYGGNLASIEHARGGAIRLEEKSLFIAHHSEFIGNRADGGGAVSTRNSTSHLSYCTFSLNQARDNGGALHVIIGSQIEIKGSIFTSNSVPSFASLLESSECSNPDETCVSTGGVIQVALSSSVVMDNCTFTNNSAEYGGTITNFVDSNITIHQCIFFNNTGLVDGAVLYSEGFLTGNITKSIFLRNRATENGGVISLYNKNDMNIDGSMFGGNSASAAGGAIYCHRPEKLTVNNCTFIGNLAGGVPGSATTTMVRGDLMSLISYTMDCMEIETKMSLLC